MSRSSPPWHAAPPARPRTARRPRASIASLQPLQTGAEPVGRLLRIPPRRVLVAASRPSEAFLRGIARHSRKHGWHLVTDVILAGAPLDDWRGDGVIVFGAVPRELSAATRTLPCPCVVVNGPGQETTLPRVDAGHEEIGRQAAEHLLRRTHRAFAFAPAGDDLAGCAADG